MRMPSMTLNAGLCYRCWAGDYLTSVRGAFQIGQKRQTLETRTFSKCWILKDETVVERRRWVRLVRCFKRDGCGGGVGGLCFGGQDGRWQEFCWSWSRRRQRMETRIRNNFRSSTFLRVCWTTGRMVARWLRFVQSHTRCNYTPCQILDKLAKTKVVRKTMEMSKRKMRVVSWSGCWQSWNDRMMFVVALTPTQP